MYRVTHAGYIVEGRASSSQNACRLAFRKLIEAGLIKKAPKTDDNVDSTFENTQVEIINDQTK
jgi:hypothetical protein